MSLRSVHADFAISLTPLRVEDALTAVWNADRILPEAPPHERLV
jgi:hypothetical protein